MIKVLMKLGIEGMYLNITKTMYDKPIANSILSGEKNETISPKVRNEMRVPTISTPFQHSPGELQLLFRPCFLLFPSLLTRAAKWPNFFGSVSCDCRSLGTVPRSWERSHWYVEQDKDKLPQKIQNKLSQRYRIKPTGTSHPGNKRNLLGKS
jgi:hypothetical protein